jgi:hypothetical protein
VFLTVYNKLACEGFINLEQVVCLQYIGPKRKNVEVIQAAIVGHGDLYLYAMFLTVHDKLTCEVSSTWTK